MSAEGLLLTSPQLRFTHDKIRLVSIGIYNFHKGWKRTDEEFSSESLFYLVGSKISLSMSTLERRGTAAKSLSVSTFPAGRKKDKTLSVQQGLVLKLQRRAKLDDKK